MRTVVFTAMMLAATVACAPVMAQIEEPMALDAYLAMKERHFSEIDTDRDGVLIKDEIRAMLARGFNTEPPKQMVDAQFHQLDLDRDGKVTTAESRAAETARYKAVDANHDGILTPEEIQANMMRALRQHLRTMGR
jgi:hypothetical protein